MQVFVVLIVYRYILIRLFPFHLLLKILIEHMIKGALNFRNNTYSYFFSKSHSKNVFWDAMSIDSIVVPMDLCSRRSFHDTKVSPRAVQIRSPIRLRFSGDRGWCCLCRIRLKHEWHQYAVKKHISIFELDFSGYLQCHIWIIFNYLLQNPQIGPHGSSPGPQGVHVPCRSLHKALFPHPFNRGSICLFVAQVTVFIAH